MDSLFDVSSKTVLVTGGSRGIGRMIANGFVERGATVYISSRKESELRATAEEIGATALPGDLSTEAGASALAAQLAEREPKLHVLVNNAGATWGAPLAEYPDAAFDKVFSTNVKGPFHLTRALLPLLEKAVAPGDPARVIMVGSIEGIMVPEVGELRLSGIQGSHSHADPPAGVEPAPERHRQRHRPRPVREQDDGLCVRRRCRGVGAR